MKKIYLSITSHNDDAIILENYAGIPKRVGNYKLIVGIIDNTNSEYLRVKSDELGFHYYSDNVKRGYGGNNNKNFQILGLSELDVFIVCNPDILIQWESFEYLLDAFFEDKADICGVKVFESKDLSKWSSHNRSFPGLLDPFVSLFFKKKLFENDVNSYANPDWIGGAFMIFKSSSFRKLQGFDEDFFMYYEDTDICQRAKKEKMKIVYNPNFYIIHDAQRAGRKIFSKAFFMNLKSMLTYFKKHPTFKIFSI